ncbi:DNA-binding transcriptional response regulator [Thermoanaerobacter thermocopriae]|nr:hypothetical protein [Thermoanaerobacter thermocopriae]
MEERKDSKNILVIDDSVLIRLMAKSILEAEGYNVEIAATAEEAMLKVKK